MICMYGIAIQSFCFSCLSQARMIFFILENLIVKSVYEIVGIRVF